jgi:beta-galactosidase
VKDYSEEYQALWHETVYPQIAARPWLWGSFVWNMFDFSSVRRNEGGRRFINAKGLVTHDRKTRKDAFYYYKARWSGEPFVHLCEKRFENRARETMNVKCYTNQPRVKLMVNGRLFGETAAENGAAVFRDVPLIPGENRVRAMAGEREDSALWRRCPEEDPGYRLPDQEAGGAVRNWFLAEDDMRREGYFSIQNTAQELLDCGDARAVLQKYVPDLVRVMTEKSVIPLGLTLKSILSRDADEALDVKALNAELNQIPDTDA